MDKLSFIDKLGVLINVSSSSKLFVLVIAFFFFLGIVFYKTNNRNKKNAKTIYIGCVLFVVIFLLVSYHKSIGNMIDYLTDNLFILIYFPNLAVYLTAIVITNIILIVSLFNYKISKLIRNINITIYCILHYILALILYLVDKYNLDVFKAESIYQNRSAQALIELSSIIFIVWILFLIIYRLIMVYLKKEYKPQVKKVYVKEKVRVLPDYINETTIPNIVRTINTEEKNKINTISNTDEVLKQFDQMLTIEDYKILLKLLKEKKLEEERKHNESKQFKEFLDLYKSVR